MNGEADNSRMYVYMHVAFKELMHTNILAAVAKHTLFENGVTQVGIMGILVMLVPLSLLDFMTNLELLPMYRRAVFDEGVN